MPTTVGFTSSFAVVSIATTSAAAAHRRRVVELRSRISRAAKILFRIASCLALVALASAAIAQEPAPGQWGMRAPTLEPLSELALAEANGKLYLMGGYPQNRVTARTVQVYDIASDTWAYGPELPMRNNHGMAASVDGKIYLIGGQLNADDPPNTNSYVNTVYELDPAVGVWVSKAPMPTDRSSGSTLNQVYRPAVGLVQPVPGTLSFSSPALGVVESAGSATIEVQRTDGSDGEVSVAYAVTGGTAVDGTDYQSVSGVLSWSDGDAASRTFTIPVFDNPVIANSKTVILTLASPTGGSVLGTNIVTELTIYDDDQPRRRAVRK